MVLTQYFDLDIVKPSLNRLRLVNGDTANTFVITIKENGAAVTLDATLHKIIAVFKRADGEVYTQDATTGLSFTTGGVVTIELRPASFRTGTNKITLQIYKRESSSATEYPLLLTTQEQSFNARAQAIPDAGAPNAPSQLPMLEQIIHDAGEAVTNCNTATADAENAANAAWIRVDACDIALANVLEATTAANNAASSASDAAGTLNALLENIDEEPTQSSDHLVKSGGVYAFAMELVQDLEEDHLRPYTTPLMDGDANIGGMTHQFAYEDHVHPHDTTKQNVLTFDDDPTQNSNNPVKSGGVWYALEQKQDILVLDNAPMRGSDHFVTSGTVYDAIDTAAKKNIYNVKHDTDTWTNGRYQTYTDDTGTALAAIAADSVFSSQVELPSGKVVTVYETHRHNDMVYFKSETIDNVYVTAEMLLSDSGQSQLQFILHNSETPLTLHVASTTQDQSNPHKATITFEAGETDLIYSGAQTRDMEFDFVVPWDIMQPTLHLRKAGFDTDENGTLAVSFIGHFVGHTVAGGFSAPIVCAIVYFTNGTYYGAIVGEVS